MECCFFAGIKHGNSQMNCTAMALKMHTLKISTRELKNNSEQENCILSGIKKRRQQTLSNLFRKLTR